MRSWRLKPELTHRTRSSLEMTDLLIAVDGVQYAIGSHGMTAKIMAAGVLAQPLTHMGRQGVMTAIAHVDPSGQHHDLMQRIGKLPNNWRFQVNNLAQKTGTVQQTLTAAFLQAQPNGAVCTSAHTEEVGFIGEDGRISLLLQKSNRPSKTYDIYGTKAHELAMVLVALHENATAIESTLVQIDEDHCMETCPIEIADKQQVWGCVRGLDLDLKDPDLCARYGLWKFSDLTLEYFVEPDEMTPDF